MESNLSQFWNVLELKKLTQAAISKLEEALLINPRKYDALWCWEMLKLLANYALRTRMRQRFQNVLYCFQKAFNETHTRLLQTLSLPLARLHSHGVVMASKRILKELKDLQKDPHYLMQCWSCGRGHVPLAGDNYGTW